MRSWPRARRAPAIAAVLAVVVGGAATTTVATTGRAHAAAASPDTVTLVKRWDTGTSLPDVAGDPIALSSPVVGNLDGQPDAIVGSRTGNLYAYHLASGTPVPGFPVALGTAQPIDSPPSVDGSTVFFGSGNVAHNTGGSYWSVAGNGAIRWRQNVPALPNQAPTASVQTGLALGALQNVLSAVSGSLGQYEAELNTDTGQENGGFPWFEADSNFTTPAIADLYGNGQREIIEGGDSTAGNAYGTQYSNGGHLRVLSQTGNAGTGNPSGGLICQYNTDQVVQSSPAVGGFLGGNATGITFGTGSYWPGAGSTNQLLATDSNCNLRWATTLDGDTSDSPALVDALGNNLLQIAEGTSNGNGGGSVYLLNGSNGGVIWRTPALGMVIGSIVSADLGGGYQDLLVPTTGGLQILDGRTGSQVAAVTGVALQSSPLVTNDNGVIGITVAGYNNQNKGEIEHFTVSGSNGATATEAGAWPEFHHDPGLSGDAGTPPPPPPPPTNVPCSAPGSPHGYDLFASDGGVFTEGNASFCGSTGNLQLAAPVVAGATTRDLGGYWEVAADGGTFAFGDGGFYGAASVDHPAAPIVGIAPTPDGKGYWEVGADGGIFTFGDAGFYGSEGNKPLNQPIVGMAATPDGRGYWLVASDGGIFTFGDAGFYGSEGDKPLNRPIVGMAPDAATGGYWLVASDGGVFTFNAPFLGSEGNVALAKPVVGMDSYDGGRGYRLVASDGGVFDFGATFYGSTGNEALAKPIVGLSGQGS
jgi:hypothetical protein